MANSTHSTNTPVFILAVRGIALSCTGLQAPVPICKLRSIDTPVQEREKFHLDPANNMLLSISGCFCWDKTPQSRPTQV